MSKISEATVAAIAAAQQAQRNREYEAKPSLGIPTYSYSVKLKPVEHKVNPSPLRVMQMAHATLKSEYARTIRDVFHEARLMAASDLLDEKLSTHAEGLQRLNRFLLERIDQLEAERPAHIRAACGPKGPRGLCCSQGMFGSALMGTLGGLGPDCVPICPNCSRI
jgi:hypothetical protein